MEPGGRTGQNQMSQQPKFIQLLSCYAFFFSSCAMSIKLKSSKSCLGKPASQIKETQQNNRNGNYKTL